MAATSILLLATPSSVALVLILAIARLGFRRFQTHIQATPASSFRSALTPQLVTACSLVLGAFAAARVLATPPIDPASRSSPSTLLAIPVSVACLCLALRFTRAGDPRTNIEHTRAPSPAFWLVSALAGATLTVLIILTGRLALLDALLLFLAVPAWLWMLTEWRTPAAAPRPTPPHPPSRNPAPLLLLLSIPLAGAVACITLWTPAPLIADLAATAALFALLAPLAHAAGAPALSQPRSDWAAAPVLLAATVSPLVALAAAATAHVGAILVGAAKTSAAPWYESVALALAARPYLSGLARLANPTLLALTLPLLSVVAAGVSPAVRRLVGAALAITGLAILGVALASP